MQKERISAWFDRTIVPLIARIFAIIDVYDALSIDRPYRKAWDYEKVLDYLRNESGTHFDPHVVQAFFDEFVFKKILLKPCPNLILESAQVGQ